MLIQGYESKRVSARPPDPLEAIRFRMEQQRLTQRDLVPFIGSRSKVSEILSGKRPLTLSMIRALHRGLGIPAESLLQEPGTALDEADVEWDRFPIREMVARGWVEGVSPRARCEPEDVVRRFVSALGGQLALPALYKKSKLRTGRSLDKHALIAWTLRVAIRARREGPPGRCKLGTVTPDFMREVAQLSWSTRGPLLAQEFLQRHGIALIVEPHLPRTRLDGVAILIDTDQPVVGLTLRYDRLDNFWYALMHELVHVGLHLKTVGESFCDDLDIEDHDDPARERGGQARARGLGAHVGVDGKPCPCSAVPRSRPASRRTPPRPPRDRRRAHAVRGEELSNLDAARRQRRGPEALP